MKTHNNCFGEQWNTTELRKNFSDESDWIKQTQDDPCDTMIPKQKPKEKKDE